MRFLNTSYPSTPAAKNVSTTSSGALDEFYAGTLDSSFLEDLAPLSHPNQEITYETDRYVIIPFKYKVFYVLYINTYIYIYK